MLYDFINHFYIAENKKSFSGNTKEHLFKDINANLLAPYEDKISWIIIDDSKMERDAWARERKQRSAIISAINASERHELPHRPFVIINTDVDEIPDPEVIRQFQVGKKWYSAVLKRPLCLDMKFFYYNYHWLVGNWTKGHILPGDDVLAGKYDLNTYRFNDCGDIDHIPNAGWHGSYFMSVDDIVFKLKSFSHQEVSLTLIRKFVYFIILWLTPLLQQHDIIRSVQQTTT